MNNANFFIDKAKHKPNKRFTGYQQQAGTPLENFAATYATGTWGTFNSNGSVVLGNANTSFITLTHTGASNTTVQVTHKGTGVSFGGLTSTSWVTLDVDLIDGLDANDKLKITFSSDALATKNIFTSVAIGRYMDGRISLTLPCSSFTGVGGEVFDGTTFNYWAFGVIKNTTVNLGVTKRVLLRGITFNSVARPKIMVTYDYGYSGVYTYAKDLHTQYNVPGTINVTNVIIDTGAAYMTTAQLQEMHGLGWATAIRSNLHHDQYTGFDDLLVAMSDARKWNTDRGLIRGSDHAVYNTGIMMPFSRAAMQAAGIKTGRTTQAIPRQITTDVGRTDLYNMPTCGWGAGNTDTFNTFVKAEIDNTINEGKSMIMFTHDIGPGNTLGTSGSTQNDLANILQYLDAQRNAGKVDLLTINDWYDGLFT